ncbi:MAG: hypothetical protein JSS78_09040 [Bacteroidetes bacterium]|nr:hypothetical protein [Bacteroidota bacterium]
MASPIRTDSLINAIHQTHSDAQRLPLLLAACRQNDIDLDTFCRFAYRANAIAQNIGTELEKGYSEYYVAYALYLNSENDSARTVIDQAILRFSLAGKEEKRLWFKLISLKATTYQGQRNNLGALQILYPLLLIAEQDHDSIAMTQSLHQIAIIEGQQDHPQQLISLERRALAWLPQNDPSSRIIRATIFATLGKAFAQQQKYDSATVVQLKAIRVFKEEEDLYNLAIVVQRQADVYIKQKNRTGAAKMLHELLQLNELIHMGSGDLNYHLSFINYYNLIGQSDRAIQLSKEHLYGAKGIGNTKLRLSYLVALSDSYREKGDLLHYATALEELVAAKDSFYHANATDAIAEIQSKYEVQNRERTIAQQRLALFRKNLLFYGSLSVLSIFLVFSGLFFQRYQQKSKEKLRLMQETEKRQTITAIKEAEEAERKRIAADLHDSLGGYAASIKAHADEMMSTQSAKPDNIALLENNAQQMVSLLGDTIWALSRESLKLSDLSDRIKIFLQRLRKNYPTLSMSVKEELKHDSVLLPASAFHLFMIVQEAIINAIKHSEAQKIGVFISNDNSWQIAVIDNGKGLIPSTQLTEGGNGIKNMKRRAEQIQATINWHSTIPNGTTVLIAATTF